MTKMIQLSIRKTTIRFVLIAAVAVFAALFIASGTVHAQTGVIEQCANGNPQSDPTCTSGGSTGWVTGNVNSGKATYTIGDFVAYRQVLTDMTVDYTYCFGFGWDTNINGEPAVDYIGTFNNTITLADPTSGYVQHVLASPDDTVAIPADTALGATMAGQAFTGSQLAGNITTWGTSGFTINGYSNDGTADLDASGTYQQSLEYCFTATDTVVIIAWGGHIAVPSEWGNLPNPSGSPYHMSQGTRQGLFNSPRTGETDLACVSNDNTPVVTNNNEGRKEVQLQIGTPLAIGLSDFTAVSEQSGLLFFVIAISIIGLVTSVIVVNFRRIFNFR